MHQNLSEDGAHALEMLERVHMPDPASVMRRYPHQISGGQQQRGGHRHGAAQQSGAARMDEPTTALDVTVEAAVLDLITELRHDFNMASLSAPTIWAWWRASATGWASCMPAKWWNELRMMLKIRAIRIRKGSFAACRGWAPIRPAACSIPFAGRVPPPNQRPSGCVFSRAAIMRRISAWPNARRYRCTLGADFAKLETHNVSCHFAEDIVFADWQPPADLELPVQKSAAAATGQEPIIFGCGRAEKYYDVRGNSLLDLFGLGRSGR
ncbi:MAG: hypothetical protein R2911_22235 [Caldilineaceae bacterium]